MITPVNIFEGEQKQDWFQKLSPNGRIPILIDHDNDGLVVMEGQAILQYLVKKYDPGMNRCSLFDQGRLADTH
jgi:glutathione S-transferase